MREVRINKSELEKRVRANRDAHRGVFERAIEGYRKAAVRFFERQIDLARDGEQFQRAFMEPIPEDHTEDYDAVIDMLDMSEDDTVTLTAGEFRQYVRDDWGWKRDFIATSQAYIASDGG